MQLKAAVLLDLLKTSWMLSTRVRRGALKTLRMRWREAQEAIVLQRSWRH